MSKEVNHMGAPKFVDDRGRLLLGKEFANSSFLIERRKNGDLVLRPAATVPANEAWLLKNEHAFNLVAQGLKEIREGKFAPSPISAEDEELLAQIGDDE